MVVEYESLFDIEDSASSNRVLRQIIDFTGINDGQNLLRAHEGLIAASRGLETDRLADKLDSSAKRHLLLEADIAAYVRLVNSFTKPAYM